MISITSLLKIILMLNYCLLTQTYEIKSENVYEKIFKWKDLFDFSNYSKDSKFFDETNKKVIGKMKDEFGGLLKMNLLD